MNYFNGDYCYTLNSEDLHSPDLPLLSNKAKGGTLVMWKKQLDPFISVLTPDTSSFLPIVLEIPSLRTSIHIALYLPTAGQDSQYIAELAKLRNTLDEFAIKFSEPIIFIRGDANSSKKNSFRCTLFTSFCKDYNLSRLPINHMTYHHFMGHGQFDSDLDVLLYSNCEVEGCHAVHEELVTLHCKLEDSSIDSHHDLLISSASIPTQQLDGVDKSENISAPRVENNRERIVWTEEGKFRFHEITSQLLPDIRSRWQADSKASLSVLLQTTNFLLQTAASQTNKVVSLSSLSPVAKAPRIPRVVKKSGNSVAKAHSLFKAISADINIDHEKLDQVRRKLKCLRQSHRKLVRKLRMKKNLKRDSRLCSLFSDYPGDCFSDIRKLKRTSRKSLHKLHVDSKVYEDEFIADGFYDSISSLKTVDPEILASSSSYISNKEMYRNILKVVKHSPKLPPISLECTAEILKSLKQSVNDVFSITPAHYKFSGQEGLEHLNYLMNAAITDLNNLSVDELNTVWACVLYKGHGKDLFSAKSYRTISTCPMVSKAMDAYIAGLYSDLWHNATADMQFQGPASSHELAALTLTESINFSINNNVKPTSVVHLDARSAFDLVTREILVGDLFHIGIKDQGLLLIDERLKNRRTIFEWDRTLMGPIDDECGVEQGGVNSSEYFKVYNNDQLTLAQASSFGINVGPVTISCIGQADDVALIPDDIHTLQALLDIRLYSCKN